MTWLPPDEFCARVGVDPSAAGKVYRGGLVLRRSTILSMSPYLRGLWWDLTRRHGQVGPTGTMYTHRRKSSTIKSFSKH